MMSAAVSDPDLAQGVAVEALADGGMLAGHVGDDAVLLIRRGAEIFAIGAACTHYGAPLGDGLLVGDTIRCPWHHASFCLRTGEVRRGPALDPVPHWRVEQRDGIVRVHEKLERAARPTLPSGGGLPRSVVIIGGGAAGNAAAETLRNEGYAGTVTILSADDAGPCDRPNLSKGFLAGTAPDEYIPLRSPEFYREQAIDLRLNTRVDAIDVAARQLQLADGGRLGYEALLLATGAEPVRLALPGADMAHVCYLRTLADARALVARAANAKRAVVIGASFIGMEATAALRARGVEVEVVAPGEVPMARVLGREVGGFLRTLHEAHDVVFHLGTTAVAIDDHGVTLANGERIEADLVVVGIGVRPALALAEQAGLAIDRGVTVNAYLETSAPGIYAAGDIARWPDARSGESLRVEHWVVASRQGQTAARNILGQRERFDCVPFFWTEQYDFSLGYVGHAARWDNAVRDGDLGGSDGCTVSYRRGQETLAVAVVNRDLEGVRTELAFEQTMRAERV
jgi:NADPH-dependent 2,4-dienoyl-CoA reductase/sulfur reductase-like enzyme/nitrite reductase/ring-hydroxylating ferredoxin subunit